MYSRIADLDTIEGMFAGDLYYHRSNEWKESFDTNHLEPTSKWDIFAGYFDNILDQGKGMSMSDIRDMIKSEIPDVDFHYSEIKCFIEEEFGEAVQFCKSPIKNMSTFIFSSSVSVSDITNVVQS